MRSGSREENPGIRLKDKRYDPYRSAKRFSGVPVNLTTDHGQLATDKRGVPMSQKPRRPGTTVHKRFEYVDPERNHNKFYELTAEMLFFGPTVTRRWGRIGSRRARSLSRNYETWEEAKREIRVILRRRERRGYRGTEA